MPLTATAPILDPSACSLSFVSPRKCMQYHIDIRHVLSWDMGASVGLMAIPEREVAFKWTNAITYLG